MEFNGSRQTDRQIDCLTNRLNYAVRCFPKLCAQHVDLHRSYRWGRDCVLRPVVKCAFNGCHNVFNMIVLAIVGQSRTKPNHFSFLIHISVALQPYMLRLRLWLWLGFRPLALFIIIFVGISRYFLLGQSLGTVDRHTDRPVVISNFALHATRVSGLSSKDLYECMMIFFLNHCLPS